MVRFLVAVACLLGLWNSPASAKTFALGPIDSTEGGPAQFEISISYDATANGNGVVQMSQFTSYCWYVNGVGGCRYKPAIYDSGFIALKNFLPASWYLYSETFTGGGWIELSGDVLSSYIDGYANGNGGIARITSCPWQGGCAASPNIVPVPGALPLLLSALMPLGFIAWRRRLIRHS